MIEIVLQKRDVFGNKMNQKVRQLSVDGASVAKFAERQILKGCPKDPDCVADRLDRFYGEGEYCESLDD